MTDVGAQSMQRLHPLSLLFSVGLAAKRLLLPGLAVLLLSRGERYELWLMVLFLPAVAAAAASYLSFRYRLTPEELVVREGILTRNERHIPYSRVQNIDLKQNPVHRWLGVAEVRLETASGEKPEAVMRVLSLAAIEAMRDRVFHDAGRSGDAAAAGGDRAEERRLLFRLALRDLLLLGLMSNRGMALVAAMLGVFWQFEPFDLDEAWLRRTLERFEAPRMLHPDGSWATALWIAGAAFAVLALLKLLSIAWSAVRFYGFSLYVRGDDLRAEYGLVTRISATIPRQRIQRLSVRRGPLERWFGRAAVQVETAGRGRGGDDSGVDSLWLAPLIEEHRLGALLEEALPGLVLDELEWRALAPRARRRLFKRGAVVAALVSLGTVPIIETWAALLLVPGLGLAWLHARLWVRHAGYALPSDALVYRSGWWTRRTSVVRYGKIQVLALEESPFDRRNRMAALRVDTAGAGLVGHRMELRYLEAPVAAALAERLGRETGRRPFRW